MNDGLANALFISYFCQVLQLSVQLRRCEVERCLSVSDRPTLDSGPPRFRLGPADRPTAARSASRKAMGSDRPTDPLGRRGRSVVESARADRPTLL